MAAGYGAGGYGGYGGYGAYGMQMGQMGAMGGMGMGGYAGGGYGGYGGGGASYGGGYSGYGGGGGGGGYVGEDAGDRKRRGGPTNTEPGDWYVLLCHGGLRVEWHLGSTGNRLARARQPTPRAYLALRERSHRGTRDRSSYEFFQRVLVWHLSGSCLCLTRAVIPWPDGRRRATCAARYTGCARRAATTTLPSAPRATCASAARPSPTAQAHPPQWMEAAAAAATMVLLPRE